MAATFQTKTVPTDGTINTIDLGVGEYVMIPLALGTQSGTKPLGWHRIRASWLHSIKGAPSTGNITQLSTEGIEVGMCQGTTYSPTSSSFFGLGLKCVGNFTGVAPAGTNTYFTDTWGSFFRTGGSDTTGGNSSPLYLARDETGSNYPNFTAHEWRHYATDHWILTAWPCYGVEAWIPFATRKMMVCNNNWSPRDHVNAYFNTELGIGFRAANPSSANIYPTDAQVANLDTLWFRNFMTTGMTWRIMAPAVYRMGNAQG